MRVVAIDGPSGVGKSTVAQRVAEALNLAYLDTGAMYRAVALAASRAGLQPDDAKLDEFLSSLQLAVNPAGGGVEIRLQGESVAEELRLPEITRSASLFARQTAVRQFLVDLQRQYGERFGAVLEGRDIGTVVFPQTPHKFFLDARPEVRARRRHLDLQALGQNTTLERVLADLEERDRRDREREDSPLICDERYYRIDTSEKSIEDIVDEIVHNVKYGGEIDE